MVHRRELAAWGGLSAALFIGGLGISGLGGVAKGIADSGVDSAELVARQHTTFGAEIAVLLTAPETTSDRDIAAIAGALILAEKSASYLLKGRRGTTSKLSFTEQFTRSDRATELRFLETPLDSNFPTPQLPFLQNLDGSIHGQVDGNSEPMSSPEE